MKDKTNQISEEGHDLQSLEIGGTEYITRYNKKFPPVKKWARPNEMEVLAFIPGTIQKIFVREGQRVEPGDDLLVLEAMKMRNQLKSAISGVIKQIYVKEGEQVPKHHLLIAYS